MCNFEGKETRSDVGKIIKKYDVYFCDLGTAETNLENQIAKVRPCVIVSSDDTNHAISGQYMVVPIRTEHTCTVKTLDKAEEIVKMRKESGGRIYVPIRFDRDNGQYSFADVTQTRTVSAKCIYNYYRTITNPETKRRLDDAIDSYLGNMNALLSFMKSKLQGTDLDTFNNMMNEYFMSKSESNRTYNNEYDATYIIKKFDIWSCQDRDIKYVVMQSNSVNTRKKDCLMAPVETPSSLNNNNLKEYLEFMKSEGNDCISLQIVHKGVKKYSLINFSKMGMIPSAQLKRLEYSVLNYDIRKEINDRLLKLIFNDDELTTVSVNTVSENYIVEDVQELPEDVEFEDTPVSENTDTTSEFPLSWEFWYNQYNDRYVSSKDAARYMHISDDEFKRLKKLYNEKNGNSDGTVKKEKVTKKKSSKEVTYPDNWDMIYREYESGKWTGKEASDLLEIKLPKFYVLLKSYREDLKQRGEEVSTTKCCYGHKKATEIPTGFSLYYRKLKSGSTTKKEVCTALDVTPWILDGMIKRYENQNKNALCV